MEKKNKSDKISIRRESIRELNPVTELPTVNGGGMCSTAAPTGMCCTQSKTCTKTL